MGLIPSKNPAKNGVTASAKRRSTQVDFGKLNPLKTTGTVGFSAFRDNGASKARKSSNGDLGGNAMIDIDSDDDDDDDVIVKMQEAEDKDVKDTKALLSPEDAQRQGELAEGVGRIKVSFHICPLFSNTVLTMYQLKRAHSAEPLNSAARPSPGSTGPDTPAAASPPPTEIESKPPMLASSVFGAGLTDDATTIGSPLKKHRASLMGDDSMTKRLAGFTSMGDVVAAAEKAHAPLPEPALKDEDEEL